MTVLRAIHLFALAMLFMWFLLAPLACMMRDGLGPDAVNSEGAQAFARFLATFYWGPIAMVLIVIIWCTRKRPDWE